ncbi:histone-like nucleoid-structuring protein, MvaT/MvaU family [Pseudomonas mandelii]|uniref:histone-like nucleoid-structuring protein, MvaT/MvaU family n=1 Tax=Pseudomonas mandelii TaxID=75612 RepID=UPI00398C8E94
MSQLNRYRELEAQLAAQLQQLEEMKNSDSLKKEIEFEDKLKTLMAGYGVNLRDVINLLDLQAGRLSFTTRAPEKGFRAPRAVKRYHNPHSGEVVETKGGNHKTLKAWKAQYGSDTVESWLQ